MKKTSLFLIFFILGCGFLLNRASSEEMGYYNPENVLKFADYLYQTGDYLRAVGEYQRYLFYSPQDSDSTLYKIGICHRLAGNTKKAIDSFQKIAAAGIESQIQLAASYQIAYSYFLSDQYENSIRYINQALDKTKEPDERGKFQILAAFNYLYQRRWYDSEHILESIVLEDENLNNTVSALRMSTQEAINLPHKKPALAGLFSTVVPGTGKMYCKQYGDGLYSLICVCGAGLLAWDGFRENGIRSISGWLFGSVSGIFYAGNVYGSIVAARIYNHRLETDLLRRLPPVPND